LRKYTFFLILVIAFSIACTPVGTRKQKAGSSKSSQKSEQIKSKPRFSDTTYIYLGNYTPPKEPTSSKESLSDELNTAIELYHNEKYNEACERFAQLLSLTNKNKKDYQVILYYTSECYIVKNMFDPAKKILQDILSMENLYDDIKERCLVRLGQIYCVEKNLEMANRLFSQLRREFPQSKFKKLADCDAINKQVK